MDAWRHKAEAIISAECYSAFLAANIKKNGKRFKQHRPYSVPTVAASLLGCLERDDKETAKAIFLKFSDQVRHTTLSVQSH